MIFLLLEVYYDKTNKDIKKSRLQREMEVREFGKDTSLG
jgi:hypothetical protein